MRTLLSCITVGFLVASMWNDVQAQPGDGDDGMKGVYSFSMKMIDGTMKSLADYRGKVLLIVNTASQCGYTKQYATLEKLFLANKDNGFVILGFPSNDFGEQEPGTDEEIQTFCSTKFNVTFDMFSKIGVKGEEMHPLYAYLTRESGQNGDITWNFNKFLVNRDGEVVARFGQKLDPMSDEIRGLVESLTKN